MNADYQNIRWGLAFVRKSLLPASQTWTEVSYYTYVIGENQKTYYKAKQKDFPIDLSSIKSYPVLPSFIGCNLEIKPDQSVFIDWEGKYFIGKKNCFNLQPENINIIHKETSENEKSSISSPNTKFNGNEIPSSSIEKFKEKVKLYQEKIDYEQYRKAS
jgi:hypothetical protein